MVMYRRMRAYPCSEKNEGEDQQDYSPRPGIHCYHFAASLSAAVTLSRGTVVVPYLDAVLFHKPLQRTSWRICPL